MTAAQHPKHLRPAPSLRPKAPVVDFSSRIAAVPPPPPSTRRPSAQASTEIQLFSAAATSPALSDLVQNECMRGLTRAMKVKSENRRGVLYFDQGQIVHAECENESGTDAACMILTWDEGQMAPGNEFWLQSPSIEMSWQGLLMMAAQRKDEAARASRESYIAQRPEPTAARTSEPALNQEISHRMSMHTDGTVLSTEGGFEEFSDTVAYTLRLVELIGDGLGLEAFDALESTGAESTMLVFREGNTIHALEAPQATALSSYRKKCGL